MGEEIQTIIGFGFVALAVARQIDKNQARVVRQRRYLRRQKPP